MIQGSFNIASDFCVVLIPIPIVLKLNLPLRQRIIVALLFGAGFVVCFAGIVRTYYLYRITDDNRDVTWDAYPVWLGSAVELYLGIVSRFLFYFHPASKLTITRYAAQRHQLSPSLRATSQNSSLPPATEAKT